ncbi:MAG: RraA family protein [Pseudomonadota bacterium]
MKLSSDWLAIADQLNTAVILDVLDSLGRRQQAPAVPIPPRTVECCTLGSAKTLLWMDFAHEDPATYELELQAVDSIEPGEIVVCATGNSDRSGIWGELLSTYAQSRGAAGVVTDGAVRDQLMMREMGFPVYSQYVSPYDSFNRQKVVQFDVSVEIGGVTIEPGDIIAVDPDGVAVVPGTMADAVLAGVVTKLEKESEFRNAVKGGMQLTDAYGTYQVL